MSRLARNGRWKKGYNYQKCQNNKNKGAPFGGMKIR